MTPNARCRALLCLLMAAFAPHPVMMQTGPDAAAHPLSGRIWDSRARDWVSTTELERRLARARYVLLGEVHDNAGHHRLRLDLLAAMVRRATSSVTSMTWMPDCSTRSPLALLMACDDGPFDPSDEQAGTTATSSRSAAALNFAVRALDGSGDIDLAPCGNFVAL